MIMIAMIYPCKMDRPTSPPQVNERKAIEFNVVVQLQAAIKRQDVPDRNTAELRHIVALL